MKQFSKWQLAAVVYITFCCFTTMSHAQESSAGDDALAQANNPLANFTAFNVHDYYIGELTETGEDANQVWARFAKPLPLGKQAESCAPRCRSTPTRFHPGSTTRRGLAI